MAGGGRQKASSLRPKRVDINREFESLEQFTEYVSNVSATGAFIRTRNPWPVATQLKLTFTVTLDDLETLEGTGEVTRVSDHPRGMGVRFLSLSPRSTRVIHALIERQKLKKAAKASKPAK